MTRLDSVSKRVDTKVLKWFGYIRRMGVKECMCRIWKEREIENLLDGRME